MDMRRFNRRNRRHISQALLSVLVCSARFVDPPGSESPGEFLAVLNGGGAASEHGVHGAFAGYSGITVGIINTHYAYLPIPEVIAYAKWVDPNSRMWHRCLTSTGQPDFI
ncbi:unnamed protein product [Arabidopsis halleri]